MAVTQSLGGMFLVGARRVPGTRTCLQLKAGDRWVAIPWGEAARATREVALGLLELGVGVGDTVAVMAEGAPAMAYFGLAATALRARCALLWPDTPHPLLVELVRSTRARVVLLQTRRDAEQAAGTPEAWPDVRAFLVPDPGFAADGERFLRVADLRERGRASTRDDELRQRLLGATADEAAFVALARSSAAPAQLVTLSHGNVLAATEGVVTGLPLVKDDAILCARPLADPAAWSAGLIPAIHGQAPFAFAAGEDLLADMADVAPSILLAAPDDVVAVVRRLRADLRRSGREEKLEKALAVAARARAAAAADAGAPALLRWRARLGERRVFQPLLDRVGGRLRRVVTWGGPPSPGAVALLEAAGVEVVDAWSTTEAAGLVACSDPARGEESPLAKPLGRTELTVAAGGRLRARGPAFCEAATGRIAGGWFETGERVAAGPPPRPLGRGDEVRDGEGGAVRSTRALEVAIGEHEVVRRVVAFHEVDGGAAVVIEPDVRALHEWGAAHGLRSEPIDKTLERDAERDHLRAIVAEACARPDTPARVTDLRVALNRWSISSGELTPAGVPDRAIIRQRREGYASIPVAAPA